MSRAELERIDTQISQKCDERRQRRYELHQRDIPTPYDQTLINLDAEIDDLWEQRRALLRQIESPQLGPVTIPEKKRCQVDGCKALVYQSGYCQSHVMLEKLDKRRETIHRQREAGQIDPNQWKATPIVFGKAAD